MFTQLGRFKGERFETKLDLGDGLQWYDWTLIKRKHVDRRALVEAYKIQTVEVTGDLSCQGSLDHLVIAGAQLATIVNQHTALPINDRLKSSHDRTS